MDITPPYLYVSKTSVTQEVQLTQLDGVIVYLDKVAISNAKITALATLSIFFDVLKLQRRDDAKLISNTGPATVTSSDYLIDTHWAGDPQKVKKLGDDMYFLKLSGFALGLQYKYAPLGKADKRSAEALAIEVAGKMYPFRVSMVSDHEIAALLITEPDNEAINEFLWAMHTSGKPVDNYEPLVQILRTTDEISFLDTVAWVYKDHGKREDAIELYESRILPTIRRKGTPDQVKHFQDSYERIKK
jgi:hypothetical protein